jgi:hypothetical protein
VTKYKKHFQEHIKKDFKQLETKNLKRYFEREVHFTTKEKRFYEKPHYF